MQMQERRANGLTVQLVAVLVGLILTVGGEVWTASKVITELRDFRETQNSFNGVVTETIKDLKTELQDNSNRMIRVETKLDVNKRN